ncbi:low specificity L-threonine aldolase [Streptomyces sp. BH-SS-21]|uniref:L-threonine aldolase n=1 Tax=Streptomyces liliiviolaceus TaxID=2823109 RepID=A0A941B8F5_9ACTN|nr:low specificity L-threonine aldolase [Streptomyces liliiviolaceus]MBQ0851516.1 low specificity L-threonine aldolase [Streptomyces liliiviolaceus]
MSNSTTGAPATAARTFSSDNAAGASPEIVEAVVRAAAGPASPYGSDGITAGVRGKLSEIFERDVDILIVSTGSAANALSLAALTPPWGSVLCHRDSHINNDECGAPEFYTAGAKLVPLGGDDAKIDADELRAAVRNKAGDVHSVEPSVVSLTQSTETGSVYSLDELRTLGSITEEPGLRLHMDGARFAGAVAALGATPAELTWRAGVDLLSFGATKNGTMTAEAIVVFDRSLTAELSFRAKRAGQLASKMRFHAAQLDAYLTDDLWLRNATHANAMAARLQDGVKAIPEVDLLGAAEANILFCRLPQQVIEGLLADGYAFYHDRWAPGVVRFVTSFATTPQSIDDLLRSIRRYAA